MSAIRDGGDLGLTLEVELVCEPKLGLKSSVVAVDEHDDCAEADSYGCDCGEADPVHVGA